VEQVLRRIYVEERAPRLELRLVRQDLGPERARDVLDQDEPVGAEDELALLEQATLDLLELRQELDDLAGHAPDGAQRAQLGRQVGVQVADVEDLILQVELELTLQEAPQVAVDEEVARVAAGEMPEPPEQERRRRFVARGLAARRGEGGGEGLAPDRVEDRRRRVDEDRVL